MFKVAVLSLIIDDSLAKQNLVLTITIDILSSLRLLSIGLTSNKVLLKQFLQTIMRHIYSLCEWHFQVLISEIYRFINGLDRDFTGGIR